MFQNFTQSFVRVAVGTVGMALCAGVCLTGATAPAVAATVDGVVRSQAVHYADLDLSTEPGRAALDRRIRSAARAVCTAGSNDLAALVAENRCFRAAVARATPAAIVTADAR